MVTDRKPIKELVSILLVLTGSIHFLNGQIPRITSGRELINHMHSNPAYISSRMNRHHDIEGSPYLTEEFVRGAIFYNRTKYVDLDLRYNYYQGYFEFRDNDRIQYFPSDLIRPDTVWAGEDIFLYVDYLEGKRTKQAFMQLLDNRKIEVLLFKEVILIEAEPAAGYQEATPARFEATGEMIFLRREGQPAVAFRGRKSIRDLFPDHQKELLNYAKEEKLRLKNPDGIIRLCRYFESLD